MSFNPDCLKGKVVFVTGGATGICKGITEVLMRHGATAIIASRKEENLKKAVADLTAATGGKVTYVVMDVRNYAAVEAAVDKALADHGRIDILINGAAGNFLTPAHRLSANAFKTVMEIDTMGTFNVSHAVFNKYFKEHGGNIVNISATLHHAGCLLQVHAGAAKAAVDAMTKHLAVEWGPYNVRVNGIAPGPIEGTEGISRLNPDTNAANVVAGNTKNKVAEGDNNLMTMFVPLKRMGKPAEIGNFCLFFSLPEASYLTGQTVVVDGGQVLAMPNFTVAAPQIHQKWYQAKL